MFDLEKLKQAYSIAKEISLSDVQELVTNAKRQHFLPGEKLIEAGSEKDRVFLITKGLVRGYKLTEKGTDITGFINCENEIVTNIDTILFHRPSLYFFEALEKTTTLSLSKEVLEKIISKNHKLALHRRAIFEKILQQAISRVNAFVFMSPEERYLDFIKEKGALSQRVPDKYIANYLGITPVSLSRIRKRITEQKKA